jgi:hypothetical protein
VLSQISTRIFTSHQAHPVSMSGFAVRGLLKDCKLWGPCQYVEISTCPTICGSDVIATVYRLIIDVAMLIVGDFEPWLVRSQLLMTDD